MPFIHDDYQTILKKNKDEISYNLLNGQVPLRNSNIMVQTQALSKAQYLQYSFFEYVSLQCCPSTATDEYLDYWGSLKNITRKASSSAKGQVTFTGTSGVTIPASTILVSENGETYTTDNLCAVGDIVGITAVNSGTEGNQESNTTLTLQTSIAGVDNSLILSNAITQGSDVETDDLFRVRVISAFSTQVTGSTRQEHVNWALAIPGVTQAWVPAAPLAGSEVVFYVMFDRTNSYQGYPQGTDGCSQYETRDQPATGDQLTIADALYENGLRPYSEIQLVCSPSRVNIDFTITGLTAASASVQNAVKEAINDLLHAQGTPLGTNITLASISSAIENVVDGTSFTITAPTQNIQLSIGQLPEIGNLTFGA